MIPSLIARTPPPIRRTASLNIVVDGNSLAAGQGASGPLAAPITTRLSPFFASVIGINVGISGQTIADMIATPSDVDAAYASGKVNILILWETTNAIFNGQFYSGDTPAQAAAHWQQYIAARRAVHPGWHIIMLSTIPRQQSTTDYTQAQINTLNANLLAADALCAANYRAWGAARFINLRCDGSPFRYRDYTPATFAENPSLWDGLPGVRVHVADPGQSYVADLCVRAILGLQQRSI